MNPPPVPVGLKKWNNRLSKILRRPFPPKDKALRKETPNWKKISTWSLICEEILDTEPPAGLLNQYYEELRRRGFTAIEVDDMRHFAWLTAGWLNFEKMLWEWCHLDESDILSAIDWQLKDGLIDEKTAAAMREYVEKMNRNGRQITANQKA